MVSESAGKVRTGCIRGSASTICAEVDSDTAVSSRQQILITPATIAVSLKRRENRNFRIILPPDNTPRRCGCGLDPGPVRRAACGASVEICTRTELENSSVSSPQICSIRRAWLMVSPGCTSRHSSRAVSLAVSVMGRPPAHTCRLAVSIVIAPQVSTRRSCTVRRRSRARTRARNSAK